MLTDYHDSQYDKVVRMALQVVAILSSSKASMETESNESVSAPVLWKASPTPSAADKLVKSKLQLNEYFHKFMVELLKMFDSDRMLLENKGSFIIRCGL